MSEEHQHEKVYTNTFEEGRVLWVCRNCGKPGSELDDGDSNRVFDHEEYYRLLEVFNNVARDRATGRISD